MHTIMTIVLLEVCAWYDVLHSIHNSGCMVVHKETILATAFGYKVELAEEGRWMPMSCTSSSGLFNIPIGGKGILVTLLSLNCKECHAFSAIIF